MPSEHDLTRSSADELAPIPTWMEAKSIPVNDARPWKATRVRTVSLVVLTLLAVCYTLYFVQIIVFPIVLGAIMSFVCMPILRALIRAKIPRPIAAMLIVLGIVGVTGFGMMSLMGPAARWMDEIPESSHLIQKKLSFLKRPLASIDRATEEIEAFGSRPNQAKHGVTVEVNDQKLSSTVVAMTGNIVVGGLLTIALLYFLLTVGPDLAAKVGQITESHTSRWKIFEILHEAERSVSTYLLTYAVINTVLGAVITFGLWLVGLPNPALWGVMAGFLNFIPYAGATLGVVIVGFVGLLSFDSPSYALLAPAVYAFCNTLEGQFITPAILGRWMNLSPLWILLSLTFWGWLWGVGGAFIAVPLLAVTKIVCDRVPQLRPWGIILGK